MGIDVLGRQELNRSFYVRLPQLLPDFGPSQQVSDTPERLTDSPQATRPAGSTEKHSLMKDRYVSQCGKGQQVPRLTSMVGSVTLGELV